MTNDEYQQLIEFLGRKFDAVDHRFEGMDRRLDQMATMEEMRAQQAETRRHFEVVAEGLRGQGPPFHRVALHKTGWWG